MKKKLYKFLSLTLSLFILTCALPLSSAFSASYIDSGNSEFQYAEIPMPAIMGYLGSDSTVTLPTNLNSTIKEYRIVGSYSFKDNLTLEHIIIPSVYDQLGLYCFAGCKNLKSYTLSGRMTSISSGAFAGCESLTAPYIPPYIKSISPNAFQGCTGFTDVSIPSTVTTIDASAFEGCTNMTSVTIPANAKIGNRAFYNCKNLKSVYIPSTVTNIGDDAFGFYDDGTNEYAQVPGFTIYGEKGSEAEKYVEDYNNSTEYGNNYNIKFSYAISLATVSDIDEQEYIGYPVEPALNIFSGANVLKLGRDYTVKFQDNVNIGRATATITGIGEYYGETTADFYIVAPSLSTAKIYGLSTKTYNGKAQTQSITVKKGSRTLKNGTDYTVSYNNNKYVGKATLTVKGKGIYRDYITKSFTINPNGTTVKSLTAGKKQLKVKINKTTSQTTGYNIQYSTSKKFTGAKSVYVSYKTTSKTIKSLKAKKKYYVRVRVYKTVGGKKYYSAWSAYKYKTTKK